MRLVPSPPGEIVGGSVKLEGTNLLELPEPQMRSIRGNRIAMIFQEPMTSLNPVFTVGSQIMEALILHRKLSKGEARQRTLELLETVGIPSPRIRIDEYPHQMSGGMKQRVMIAMALACRPQLLIADEPTTALDVTIQAQILELLSQLQQQFGMSVLLITHNLGVVAEACKRLAVMYAGKVVEQALILELFDLPLHPYTVGLLQSLPRVGDKRERLAVIPGTVPNPVDFPPGCRFHPRCFRAEARCSRDEPELREIAPGHLSACHFAEGLKDHGRR